MNTHIAGQELQRLPFARKLTNACAGSLFSTSLFLASEE